MDSGINHPLAGISHDASTDPWRVRYQYFPRYPAFSDLNAAAEEARSVLQTERKTLVSQGLALSVDEATAFWPVYDRYMMEMKSAGDLRVKVITDYAANYDDLSDDMARELLANSLKYQEKILDIRKSYLRK